MSQALRVLIVEDSEHDAELVLSVLERGGYDPVSVRVETGEALTSALQDQHWDVIISDYNLPQFSAPAALTVLKDTGIDLPFLIVSGAVGEEAAAVAMKAGAHDFISKNNLARLVPAVERELREAVTRQECKRLEEALRQSQKIETLGRFANGFARDFSNIVTVIIGYSSRLLSRVGDSSPLRGDVNEIRDAAERAAWLTHHLLAFSHTQALQPSVLNPNALISGMQEMLRHLIGVRIQLFTLLDPGVGRIYANQSQFEQMIMHLVVNSRDAMPEGGTLTIESSNIDLDDTHLPHQMKLSPGPYIVLAVSDTGCGMDKETQARVFEPFFTTRPEGKGFGLGLSTVYSIVRQNGGDIRLASEPGGGTTFKIYLPRVEEVVESPGLPLLQEATAGATATILLVEDEEQVRALARKVLIEEGYTVLEASEGRAALLIGERHNGPIHLVLTDIVMPDVIGQTLTEQLAQFRPDLRVLYMSGYTGVQYGVMLQGQAFLQKPFTPEMLTAKVRETLNAPLAQTTVKR